MKQSVLIFIVFLMIVSCDQKRKTESINLTKTEVNQIKVVTLSTFHFDFPNKDVVKIENDNQIDVLEPKYQEEIKHIVDKLAKFKPTKIAIEIDPAMQSEYDSLYNVYLKGYHTLSKDEAQQIGFRLAKKMNLKGLDCVNAWDTQYEYINRHLADSNSRKKFIDFFYNHPDKHIKMPWDEKALYKTQGILAELKRINTETYRTADLGSYLIGVFKYETPEYKDFGVDFTTGWWFNRNLKIFRNIQRLDATPEDRILVIYGSGHMNLFNIFFNASPEYELMDINSYLN